MRTSTERSSPPGDPNALAEAFQTADEEQAPASRHGPGEPRQSRARVLGSRRQSRPARGAATGVRPNAGSGHRRLWIRSPRGSARLVARRTSRRAPDFGTARCRRQAAQHRHDARSRTALRCAPRSSPGFDAIVHLAGLAHSTRAIPDRRTIASTPKRSRTLAEASRDAGVKRFVLVSSVRAQSGASADHVLSRRPTHRRLPTPTAAPSSRAKRQRATFLRALKRALWS